MYEYIKICLFLYLYFQNVVSYRIYQLDSAEEKKLLPKVRQLLLNQKNDESEYQSVNVRHGKSEQPRLKPIGKSVLVKRVIPHGYVTGEYEYDSKLNTVFKPLARLHVEKLNQVHIKPLLKQKKMEQKEKDHYAKDLVVLVKQDEIKQDLPSQIQKYLGQNMRQPNLKKVKGFRILDRLDKDLLAPLRQKSGEQHDPFAYGKLPPEMEQSSSDETVDEKTVVPSYPYWNYWTYQKGILQDGCPGNLVRVGNMCISSLGHRRSAGPSDTRRSHQHHNKRRHSIRAARKKHLYGGRK